MLLEHQPDWFKTRNQILKVGDFAVELDSKRKRTNLSKQGIGKRYNDTPYSTVNYDYFKTDKGFISVPKSGGKFQTLSATGLIEEGTGVTITGLGTTESPYVISAPDNGTVATIGVEAANGFSGTSDGDPTNPKLTIDLQNADSTNDGKLTSADWNVFNGKQDALGYTPYNATNPSGYISGIDSGDVITALGYTPYNSTNPSGYISGITSGMITSALGYTPYNATNPNGYITGINNSDVTTALGYTPVTNARTLTINGTTSDLTANRTWSVGTVTSASITTANGISGTVATATTTPAITLTLGAITPTSVAASGTVTGSNLSGTNTGNQTITLTGDVTGTGTASFAATLATVNSTTGSFGSVSKTVSVTANGKGLITSISEQSIVISESQVTNLTTDLAAKQATLVSGTNIKTINGVTLLGAGDLSTTQTSVSGNAGTATALQTARLINGTSFDGTADITVSAAAGTLTGTTLNSSVVTSSLTSVGTIATGTWSATTIAANKGGTGLTSYTTGDLVYASGATTLASLADVASGSILTSGGVSTAPSWSASPTLTTSLTVPTIYGSSAASGSLTIQSTSHATKGAMTYNGLTHAIQVSGTTRLNVTSTQTALLTNLLLNGAGNGIQIKEGSNCTMGTVTLVGGTAVVSTNKVTATSRIFLTVNGGTLTNVASTYVSSRSAGVSFTISSLNVLDVSSVAWWIIEPL